MRNALHTSDVAHRLQTYDPEINEPQHVPLKDLQELDIQELSTADAMIVCWSRSTDQSKGVAAEIEWAVRFFHVPIIVFLTGDYHISPWTLSTLASGDTAFCRTPEDLVKCLKHIMPKEPHEPSE
jgi:hypothetical protein